MINYLKGLKEELSEVKKESKQKRFRKIFKDSLYWLGQQPNKIVTEKKIRS